jgi:iron complex outermembrane recepter protein
MRQGFVVTVLALGIMGLSQAKGARAEISHYVNVPAQPLGAALAEFARTRDLQLIYHSEIVGDQRTAGAVGDFTPQQELERLLRGTGLTYRYLSATAVTIVPIGPTAAPRLRGKSASPTSGSTVTGGNREKEGKNGSSSPFRLAHLDRSMSQGSSPMTGLAEVIVTATRRAQSLQQVAGGIVPITQGTVRDTGAQTLSDIAASAPGLSFDEMSPTEQVFTIRGVNTTSQVSTLQSPTALYFDEIPVSDPYLSELTPSFQLFDVSRVEVLLGPQGTLFGAGALGGAVRVISNKPQAEQFDADAEETTSFTSEGNPTYATDAMVDIPLVDHQLALRMVGTYIADGGYIDNVALGSKRYNALRTSAARAELKWQISPKLSVLGTYAYESDRPDASPYTLYGSKSYVFYSGVIDRSPEVLNIANVDVVYDGDDFTFTSSTSYVHRDPTQQTDITGLASQITGLANPAIDVVFGHTRNLVQEFRFASPEQQAFRWLGGIYLQKYDIDEREVSAQPGAGNEFASIGYPSDTILNDTYTGYVNEEALYGETSYDFAPKLSATVGARAFHDSVAITDAYGAFYLDGGPGSLHNAASYSGITPKFVLSYEPTGELMYYLQVSEGFRSGEGNLNNGTDPVTGEPIPTFYGPDHLWNYEVGAKTTLFGNTTLNGDLYDIDWRNIQLNQQSPSGLNFTNNAGRAWIRGVDLQVTSRLSAVLEIGANLDYHRSRLTEVNPGVDGVVGDQLPGSSRFSSYVYGKYGFPLGGGGRGFFRLDYSYASKAYSNLDNATSLHYGNVGSLDAQVGAHFSELEYLLFGRNLAGGRNRVNAFELVGSPAQILQTPRTFGLTVRWNY